MRKAEKLATGTVIRTRAPASVEVSDVGLRRPTLDDVFLTLTGHRTETEPEIEAAP